MIGTHLASLNLFREPDGSVQITVAGAGGAIAEIVSRKPNEAIAPANYVDRLIVEAAKNIVARRPDLRAETFEQAWAKKEAEGYQYGGDALENVRFGWNIAKGLE